MRSQAPLIRQQASNSSKTTGSRCCCSKEPSSVGIRVLKLRRPVATDACSPGSPGWNSPLAPWSIALDTQWTWGSSRLPYCDLANQDRSDQALILASPSSRLSKDPQLPSLCAQPNACSCLWFETVPAPLFENHTLSPNQQSAAISNGSLYQYIVEPFVHRFRPVLGCNTFYFPSRPRSVAAPPLLPTGRCLVRVFALLLADLDSGHGAAVCLVCARGLVLANRLPSFTLDIGLIWRILPLTCSIAAHPAHSLF